VFSGFTVGIMYFFYFVGDAGPGEPATAADVTFTLDKDTIMGLFSGQVKPTTAFMKGKIKIKGDMMKAMKLESLLVKAKL
jgi:putative sterol carrier protein